MSKAHVGSELPLSKYCIPIDYQNTAALFHYDITLDDINGIKPAASPVATLRETEGRYGGAVAVEESTTNLLSNGHIERTGGNEYLMYANLAPIFDANGVGTYTFSFDLRSALDGSINAYCTDRATDQVKYSFGAKLLNASTQWQRFSMTVNVTLNSATATHTSLAFYGTYGTGRVPSVRNVQIEKKQFATSFTPTSRSTGELIYPIPLTPPYTISFWHKPTIPNNYTEKVNWVLTANPYTNDFIMWKRTTEDYYRIRIGGLDYAFSNTDIRQDTWSYVCIVVSNANTRIYLNGEYKGTINAIANVSAISLGSATNSSSSATGNLFDEFRLDNVARTDNEIAAWYLSNSPFFPRGIQRIAR